MTGPGTRAWAIVAVLVLVGVLAWAGVRSLPGEETGSPADEYRVKVHRHAGFRVYLDDEFVSFRHCALDIFGCREPTDGKSYEGQNFKGAHLHMDEPYDHVLHMEYTIVAGARNITLRDFFQEHDMNITNGSVRFHDVAHAGRGTVANNATHSWQLWVSHCFIQPETWEREDGIQNFTPLQHDRFVLAFVRPGTTAADLAAQFAAVPGDEAITEAGFDACPTLGTGTTGSPAAS